MGSGTVCYSAITFQIKAIMNVKSIFFDLDGTLIDSFPGIKDSIQHAFGNLLPGRHSDFSRDIIGPPINEIFERIVPDLDSNEIARLTACFRVHYNKIGYENFDVFPGVESTLEKSQKLGLKMCIVTNKPSYPTQKMIQKLGWEEYFDETVTSDSQDSPFKSKAHAVRDLIKRHDLNPNDVVMVGDSVDDAKAAILSNIEFVGVSYGYGSSQIRSTFPASCIIDDLSALIYLIH